MVTGKRERGKKEGGSGNVASGNDDVEVKLKTIKSELRLLPCVSVCDHFSLTQTTHKCTYIGVSMCVLVCEYVCLCAVLSLLLYVVLIKPPAEFTLRLF